jgi:hypothetical protein
MDCTRVFVPAVKVRQAVACSEVSVEGKDDISARGPICQQRADSLSQEPVLSKIPNPPGKKPDRSRPHPGIPEYRTSSLLNLEKVRSRTEALSATDRQRILISNFGAAKNCEKIDLNRS